jgi:hypothetical protein
MFKSLCIFLYADDLEIFFPVTSNSDFANAQAELGGASQWCIDNGLQLNLEKCKNMSFTRSRFTRHFQYQVTGWTVWTAFVILEWFST